MGKATHDWRVGDRFAWARAGNDDRGVILELRQVGRSVTRAKLKVDGWAGTTWETLDYHFVPETTRKRRTPAEVSKPVTKREIAAAQKKYDALEEAGVTPLRIVTPAMRADAYARRTGK